MDKIRYSVREAQAALGIGNSKFWNLAKAGIFQVYYDGGKGYVSHENVVQYDAECRKQLTNPQRGKPRAAPGKVGVQAPEPAA